jgi:hypothetical protein
MIANRTETSSTPSALDALRAAQAEALAPRPKVKQQTPPQYMTKTQGFVLKMAQDAGWVIRSMVANTKTHKVAISLEKDGEVAWITSDGSLKSESEVVKASGSV